MTTLIFLQAAADEHIFGTFFIILILIIVLVAKGLKKYRRYDDDDNEDVVSTQQPPSNNLNSDKFKHLRELKEMLDSGILTEEEFNNEKTKVLTAD